MLNFCTLFDSVYLSRGVAMYNSLKKHCENFHLYIFAFDDDCYRILKEFQLEDATIISLKEFENEDLLRIKPTRTRGEYCWTCTPSTISYVLDNYDVDNCTYLDSDLYFYSSPQPLLDEMGDASVLITPHRYTKKYDQSQKTGIYCVQFVTFKKDERGLHVLDWWKNACIEWCYNRFEDGKFGDQKYLDDWPMRFDGVYVSQNLGGGVAPWNMQQYTFNPNKEGEIIGTEKKNGNLFKVIFFHFHSFIFIDENTFSPRPFYKREESSIIYLFRSYIKEIKDLRQKYSSIRDKERYLKGYKRLKYDLEVFVRRGLKELHYKELLHKNI